MFFQGIMEQFLCRSRSERENRRRRRDALAVFCFAAALARAMRQAGQANTDVNQMFTIFA